MKYPKFSKPTINLKLLPNSKIYILKVFVPNLTTIIRHPIIINLKVTITRAVGSNNLNRSVTQTIFTLCRRVYEGESVLQNEISFGLNKVSK